MDPDESVSRGAAICGVVTNFQENKGSAALANKVNLRLNDVTPLPIGVSCRLGKRDDVMSVIVEQNSLLPCQRIKTYTTSCDKQTVIEFEVSCTAFWRRKLLKLIETLFDEGL